uniref:Uncharacterized protein n=1 Tax=Ciona intestinalis TaxID=7719 RepID=H2XQ75_CIOIN
GRSQKVNFVQKEGTVQQDNTNCEEAYVNLEGNRNSNLKNTSHKSSDNQSKDALQQDNTNAEDAYEEFNIQNTKLDIPASHLVKRYKDMLASNEAAFKKQFRELERATKEIKLPKTHAENPK